MAWKLKYRCDGCGYEAEVYEGRGLFRHDVCRLQKHSEYCGGWHHCRCCSVVQERGGTLVSELWQRPHQSVGQTNLSEVPGQHESYGRKGVLDVIVFCLR